MRVLVTGFEPFGGEQINASGEAVKRLALLQIADVDLVVEILPVSFVAAPRALQDALIRLRPDVVIAVGEAGGRTEMTPELWAVNQMTARIADNDGDTPAGPIDGGPDLLASRLDVKAALAALQRAGLPARSSEDAGEFVCNALFRALLTQFDRAAGFVHVPAVREGAPALVGAETDSGGFPFRSSGLTFDDLAEGLRVIVESQTGTSNALGGASAD